MLRQGKSLQKCRPPIFFLTSTTALHHALWLGHMAPESSISCRWLWTSTTKDGRIHLNCSLKGVSLVILITCLVDWVQQSSPGSKEKTLWYLAKNSRAESASSGGHNSKPLSSSSSNNFLASVLWSTWVFGDCEAPPPPSGKLVITSGSGTTVATTAWATRVFFLRVWG